MNTSPHTLAAVLLISASALLAACGPIVSSANAQAGSKTVATGSVSGASPHYFGDEYAAEQQKLAADGGVQAATF
jgi:hypothetical protein